MTKQLRVKPGDLFATPPASWWSRWLCRAIGAKTFHWGVLICPVNDDWIVSESIEKGTVITLLGVRKAKAYRIKGLAHEPKPMHLIEVHAKYGELPYDWEVGFRTAVWWLLKHYLGIVVKVVRDRAVNCQEWVVLFAHILGVKIISDDEYPMSVNLENSPFLEYIGEID